MVEAGALPNLRMPSSVNKDKDLGKLLALVAKSILYALQGGRDLSNVIIMTFRIA